MRRTLTGATLAALGVLAPASALAEPPLPPASQEAIKPPFPTRWQDAVLRSVADQRTLGLSPCEPTFGVLPADLEAKGVVADAADTYTFGRCEIRWMSGPVEDVPSAAWHEVCHLSTAPHITSHPAEHRGEDPYHSHESFLACLRLGPQGWATTDYLP